MPTEMTEAERLEYQKSVDWLWSSAYMNYPREVHLETSTVCPAACGFCPYPTLERKGNRMSDALVDKILADLRDIPRQVSFDLAPFKVSEPFADRRIFDIVRKANRELPNALISFNTSAIPITPRVLEELLSLERVFRMRISLNDHRQEEYARVMGVPLERTLRAVRLVHDAKVAGRIRFPVRLTRVGDGTAADEDFRAWVAREFPAFPAVIFVRGDWLGGVDDGSVGSVPDVGCGHWFELSITSTGVVALCCMDGEARFPIGDARSEHVLDIYNKPAYKRLRLRARSRRAVEPCNRCTLP